MGQLEIKKDKAKEIKSILSPCLTMFLRKGAALLMVVIISVFLIINTMRIEEGVPFVYALLNSKDILNLIVSINISLVFEMVERIGNVELKTIRMYALMFTTVLLVVGIVVVNIFDRDNPIYYVDKYKMCISHVYEVAVLMITIFDYFVVSCEALIIKCRNSKQIEMSTSNNG